MDGTYTKDGESFSYRTDNPNPYKFTIDIALDSASGNFIAKKDGTEFSVANSAYAGMIVGYTCIRKNIFDNYKLKGYYGEYFLDLIAHCKKLKKKIIEIPFNEMERASGLSKTGGLNLRYIVISVNYFFCFLKVFIKKFL